MQEQLEYENLSLIGRVAELMAENERLLEEFTNLFDAVWEALDGLYGGDWNGEEIPINLLPEDRQQLFHRVLELVGSVTKRPGAGVFGISLSAGGSRLFKARDGSVIENRRRR